LSEYKINDTVQSVSVPGIRKYGGGVSLPSIVVEKMKSLKSNGKKSIFDELVEKNIIVKNSFEPAKIKDENIDNKKSGDKK